MLYDAVGVHYDPRCLQRRLASAILAWSRDEPVPGQQRAAPTERQVWAAWRQARSVAGRNCPWAPLAETPFPDDILRTMQRQQHVPPGPPFP
eukprot:658621-Pyramimonas_sp.AAC.1